MDNSVLQVAKKQLIARSKHNIANAALCTNVESVKIFLVLPFIQFLGYDITDPKELFPEYKSSTSTISADLVLLKNDETLMLINVVNIGEINEPARLKIKNAFENSEANIAILTDGIVYEVYTDLSKANFMDKTAFIEFSMQNLVAEQGNIPSYLVEDIAFNPWILYIEDSIAFS